MDLSFVLQLALILVCLFYGARRGGLALGLLGGIGVVVLVFGFGLKPGKPPVDVMLTIVAVVAASATLQASGGLDVLLQAAEKLLRRNPRYVSVVAPLTTAALTMLCGTGHVVYTMLPIIYDVAIKNGVRPERPMAAASVASQMGIIASPVSVAVVSLVAFMAAVPVAGHAIDFATLLSITIPSTLAGVLAIGAFSWFRGKDLERDPEFQALIATPEGRARVYGEGTTLIGKTLERGQWVAMWIFVGAIAVVALLGAVESLRPVVGGKPLSMVLTIQMFMLLAGALILLATRTDASQVSKNEVFRAGMVAVVAVFGIAWMADTMFDAHIDSLKEGLAGMVREHPWTYAIALLLVSKLVNSQAAAISALVPVALSVGVPPGYVVAFAAACYGYYILPTYPSDLAAIQFDRSGTTRIGRFVVNHSFILPGLIGVGTSCVAGWLLAEARGLL
ncbi:MULTISPECIES: anaerobic C4-dicarboxylate transporter [Rubrivivax]|uniref:C4-dicarboxylate transporter n=1 Tax=Rubrivivax benzoatilyticus TaxID=316997 RepID=A0ABX0HZV6_9BURK|nr:MULTISPECIES: anaerobic C4-dicarboxylate transporter [Rubrivivax]EGJ08770.1 anaerobic c4-dicarboxylate membrane transporter family protein [Rubrivivax benzoatilyticus JA2 = ATCC BAA-35]NHK99955.1 anaerobic C4-dicarboxylate transporter [Rubrivivax benzoatilyticus]NHL25766.1 anaerobic C4-dicarboxylate transporter [Rubrivivax benzoatilyticus]